MSEDIIFPMYCSPRKQTRLLNPIEKSTRYAMAMTHLELVLPGEEDIIARMATTACVLNGLMESFYWTGFYRVSGDTLVIGPYQGTMGCLRITKGRGVCGTAWERGEPLLVPDIHLFPGHIACDTSSQSEIVVPVRNKNGDIVAVFDVDSDIVCALDEQDLSHLKHIMTLVGTGKLID